MGKYIPSLVVSVAFVLAVSCATTGGPSGRPTKSEAELSKPLETIAVLYFDNNSVADQARMEYFRKGLAELLIADLASAPGIRIVERERLQQILQEQNLGSSAFVDKDTQLRLGKILQAQAILVGSYSNLGQSIFLDARLVDVETSRVLFAEGVSGPPNEVFRLEKQLAGKIANSLGKSVAKSLRAAAAPGSQAYEAALCYSQGLDLEDQNRHAEALVMYQKALSLDPTLEPARTRLEQAKTKI